MRSIIKYFDDAFAAVKKVLTLVAYGLYGLSNSMNRVHFPHTWNAPAGDHIEYGEQDMELEFDESVVIPSNN